MQNCKICCLYSGSKGNCTYIAAGGAKILIDAGKSAKSLCSGMKSIGVDIDDIDAIFITHEHSDHISALQTLSHKRHIPIHMLLKSAWIFDGLNDERLCSCLMLYQGNGFETDVKGLHVKAFPTPHDSRGSVGYRLTYTNDIGEDICLAVATDTGYVTEIMRENLIGCRAVVIESNHDAEMLADGPYPYELKQRIRSRFGHLSNTDCAAFASELCENGTEYIMLAHLSEENNIPSLAYEEVCAAIANPKVYVNVARQDEPVWLVNEELSEKPYEIFSDCGLTYIAEDE